MMLIMSRPPPVRSGSLACGMERLDASATATGFGGILTPGIRAIRGILAIELPFFALVS